MKFLLLITIVSSLHIVFYLTSDAALSNIEHGCCRGPEQTEFDDLISALRTGDVFGENMKRHEHRNRKSRTSPPRVERMESFLR